MTAKEKRVFDRAIALLKEYHWETVNLFRGLSEKEIKDSFSGYNKTLVSTNRFLKSKKLKEVINR